MLPLSLGFDFNTFPRVHRLGFFVFVVDFKILIPDTMIARLQVLDSLVEPQKPQQTTAYISAAGKGGLLKKQPKNPQTGPVEASQINAVISNVGVC